jgi:hypothetical protein
MADDLTAICEPTVYKTDPDVSQLYRPPGKDTTFVRYSWIHFVGKMGRSYMLKQEVVPTAATVLYRAESQSQSYLTTDCQSASLSCYPATIWDPRTNFLSHPWKFSFSSMEIFLRHLHFLSIRRHLWREDGSVIYSYKDYKCSASSVTIGSKSRRNLGHILLSPLRLGSFFVASYDSQGYSGSILTLLHTGFKIPMPMSS